MQPAKAAIVNVMILVLVYLLLSDSPTFAVAFPVLLVTLALGLLLAMTIHEYGHALVAYRLGDITAKRMGRLSPNPLRHLDPIGTSMLIGLGLGWAKPVVINSANLRRGRQGIAAVAAAGPLINLATAAVFCIPVRAGLISNNSTLLTRASFSGGFEEFVTELVIIIILFNLALAVVNMLPIFPLDGSKVALSGLPVNLARRLSRVERYGPIPFLVIFALDYLAGTELIRRGTVLAVNQLGRAAIGAEFF